MIFTGFLPNTTKRDLWKSLGFLLLPWQWLRLRKGGDIIKAEEWLKKYFNVSHATTFDSGRTALQKALETLEIREGDEVLVQAYTCGVVSNAIKWASGKPIYVDVENSFNMNPEDLEKKITNKSKILIIQHTFGTPANLERLLEIAKKYNLKIIEDCAHSLGVKYNEKLTGTFGDIGMFSFGTDKVVSCMRGGALITNDDRLNKEIKKIEKKLPLPKRLKTVQYLLAFPAFAIGKPLYSIGGRYFLGILKKLNIFGRIMYDIEKKGREVRFYPSKLANSFASILLDQLKNLEDVNQHRRDVADLYFKKIKNDNLILPQHNISSIHLRFTILVDKPIQMLLEAKKQGIMLGNWYCSIIDPVDYETDVSGYILGSCPNAEALSRRSINLPTNRHITDKKARKIIEFVNNYLE